MPEGPIESSPKNPRRIPLREEVTQRAHELWEAAGRPHGRSEEFWHQAELQLLGADSEVRETEDGAVSAKQYEESTDANHAKRDRRK